ncbi:hypothetical protein BCR36DRAFT_300646 [Piromyces finnis]|uniref:Uncharacterized protein n=1 Tax=Piromyces finnis TaxID=1754191 RepID=A0A1Y1V0W7_9FUNG|nr:hypothetical protein BCR36DRAFT_300646 [Piromyces finnis]|eukprot:ORX44844.1 hypothetical protein BCR36DRAFT_300646 [Piromyces finnis]
MPRDENIENTEKEETEEEIEDGDINDSKVLYRVYSKNRRNKIRNRKRNKSFETSSKTANIPNEFTENKEDQSETYVNKKIDECNSRILNNSIIEEATDEQLMMSETIIDDDLINEVPLENKNKLIDHNNNEIIILSQSTSGKKRRNSKKSKSKKSSNKKKILTKNNELSEEYNSDNIKDSGNGTDLSEVKNKNISSEIQTDKLIEYDKFSFIKYIISLIFYLIGLFNIFQKSQKNNKINNTTEDVKSKEIKINEKSNFKLTKDEKPNFRLRKTNNLSRQSKKNENDDVNVMKITNNKDINLTDKEKINIVEDKINNKSFNDKKTILRILLLPFLIYIIGKSLMLLPDKSDIIELVFDQFNISEEQIPIFLLFVNGIFVLLLKCMIESINYIKSQFRSLEKDNTYIDRAYNLSRILITNLVLYAIAVFGTSVNSNTNVSLISQLSVLYTILTIPYTILVMLDNHHYLPLPQGVLLFIFISGCVPIRLINRGELYEKIITLPDTISECFSSIYLSPSELYNKLVTLPSRIHEIRQNTIHY